MTLGHVQVTPDGDAGPAVRFALGAEQRAIEDEARRAYLCLRCGIDPHKERGQRRDFAPPSHRAPTRRADKRR